VLFLASLILIPQGFCIHEYIHSTPVLPPRKGRPPPVPPTPVLPPRRGRPPPVPPMHKPTYKPKNQVNKSLIDKP